MHRGASTTVVSTRPGEIILSFSKIAFVSDSKVKLIVNECGVYRDVKTSLRVRNLSHRTCGMVYLTKLRGLTILGGGGRTRGDRATW